MSRANPYYNPKWEEIHDLHAEQRDLYEKRSADLVLMLSKGDEYKAAHEAASECFYFHQKICLYCLDTMQHPTIEAFWDWAKSFVGRNSFISDDGREVFSADRFDTFIQAKDFVNSHQRRHGGGVPKPILN